MDEWKRNGQIPAFGNWDFANELPITQYFECARQAGLVRYSSSCGESDPYTNVRTDRDLYAVDVKKQNKKGNREIRCSHHVSNKEHTNKMMMRKQKQQKRYQQKQDDDVDEDLYKIPPELLRTTKRKKMLGFISKCLVPAACVS